MTGKVTEDYFSCLHSDVAHGGLGQPEQTGLGADVTKNDAEGFQRMDERKGHGAWKHNRL